MDYKRMWNSLKENINELLSDNKGKDELLHFQENATLNGVLKMMETLENEL